jgi:hypothetical protein
LRSGADRSRRPMWPVAVITIFVVTVAGILLARQPRLRDWLRRP